MARSPVIERNLLVPTRNDVELAVDIVRPPTPHRAAGAGAAQAGMDEAAKILTQQLNSVRQI